MKKFAICFITFLCLLAGGVESAPQDVFRGRIEISEVNGQKPSADMSLPVADVEVRGTVAGIEPQAAGNYRAQVLVHRLYDDHWRVVGTNKLELASDRPNTLSRPSASPRAGRAGRAPKFSGSALNWLVRGIRFPMPDDNKGFEITAILVRSDNELPVDMVDLDTMQRIALTSSNPIRGNIKIEEPKSEPVRGGCNIEITEIKDVTGKSISITKGESVPGKGGPPIEVGWHADIRGTVDKPEGTYEYLVIHPVTDDGRWVQRRKGETVGRDWSETGYFGLKDGRLYFGTDKGLNQFDPRSNRWQRYTRKDGLASDMINHLHKDRRGCIWVSTPQGLTKFDPRAERTAKQPAPIYFHRVNIAGEDLPLPETGAINIPILELPAWRNNLAIEFVGLQFASEDALTYQYRLEGVDADWGAPGKTRAVNYARLAPGAYHFQARAINREGILSKAPVTFVFRILSPLYLRWWFLALIGLPIGLAVYGFYRYRLARLLELERVRTRIATDLHDDIGASLSRVAILSEVVKRQVGEQAAPLLTEIADSARGLVESMREIVWAIDPRRDDLGNVVVRVRQFASDVLEARGVNWDFKVAPRLEQSLR